MRRRNSEFPKALRKLDWAEVEFTKTYLGFLTSLGERMHLVLNLGAINKNHGPYPKP